MRGTVASVAAAGALLIPSSSGPSNAKLQHEITRLQRQVSALQVKQTCLQHAVEHILGGATISNEDTSCVAPAPVTVRPPSR